MVNHSNPYDVYKQNQVQTARPEQLTLMLYNGGIRFLQQAKLAIQKKDMTTSHSLILRVQEIVTELHVTLNYDYEISKNLASLYDYMKRRLIEANLNKDIQIIEEVEHMLTELKDTWIQAMKSLQLK